MANDSMSFPPELRYSTEHLWLRVEGDTGWVGITDYAQDQLGEIVYVKLPEVGEKVTLMKRMGDIESLKIISELFSPASGEIVEVNAKLEQAPEIINSDPYGAGWLVRVRMTDPAEAAALLDNAAYAELVGNQPAT
jgi:glycine cleavage system H protein